MYTLLGPAVAQPYFLPTGEGQISWNFPAFQQIAMSTQENHLAYSTI